MPKQQKNPTRTRKGSPAKTTARSTAKPPAKTNLLHHHAKRIYHVTPKFVHGMVAGAFVGILVVTGLKASGMVSALSISSPRDCDSNAVITCGALTTSELQTRYKNAGVSSIYNYFKISSKDISNISKTAESGRVYKDGKVTINGVIVATGAVTAGRENISGSTKVTSGTVTFYTRQPKVSFNPDYINAFVVMESGQFKFAILGACGNPVKATPIPKKTTPTPSPTPTPTPSAPTPPVTPPTEETPTPTPTPPTTTSTQTPPSTPIVTLASSEKAPVTLPDTGPEQIILIAALAIIGGYFFHAGHRHVRHKHAHRT